MKALILVLLFGVGIQCFGQTRSILEKSPEPRPLTNLELEYQKLEKKSGVQDPYVLGCVRDFWGRSISKATIRVFCLDCDDVFVARTNMFGYYKIEGLTIGSSYLISVTHGKHLFTTPSASFTAEGGSIALDFEAGP